MRTDPALAAIRRARLEKLCDSLLPNGEQASQSLIASRTGMSLSQIGQWLSGNRLMSEQSARRIESAMRIAPRWLDTPNTSELVPAQESHASTRPNEWEIALREPVDTYSPGVPLLTWQQIAEGDFVSSQTVIPCPVAHGPGTFAARVRGNAMHNPSARPSFSEDDLIFVDPSRAPEHRSLVLVRHEGQALFRQYLIEPEGAMLAALNPSWPDRFVRANAQTQIIGTVVFGGYVP